MHYSSAERSLRSSFRRALPLRNKAHIHCLQLRVTSSTVPIEPGNNKTPRTYDRLICVASIPGRGGGKNGREFASKSPFKQNGASAFLTSGFISPMYQTLLYGREGSFGTGRYFKCVRGEPGVEGGRRGRREWRLFACFVRRVY
ncbi:hypothetical protein GWI33_023056 [Rhynchophorus ferrugineus]|uniref:Uncharacterized protein n=1 Tax=Rhynchophorus ferrugineus TaxID=354439 RepID=A0A834HNF1_RHYFE|nr:hypothetical protein GWI33_023056 [Rhynchophorus ferrugineus]